VLDLGFLYECKSATDRLDEIEDVLSAFYII